MQEKIQRRWLTVAVIALLAVGAGFLVFFAINPARAAGGNFYVNAGTGDDTWDGTSPTYVSGTVGPKKTIQSCIVAAGAGDIVNVAAGTYTETGQILINKDLSIAGVDRDTTILKPAQDTAYRGAWIQVNSGCDLNLSRVTLDCAGRSIFYAVLCNGTGTVDGCLITNVRWAHYYGFGVAIRGGYMTVSNNTFSNIERVSTYVARDGVSPQPAPSDITGNSYTGKGVGDWLDYAVEVGRGALANITNNTIHNNVGVAASDGSTSAGILVTTYYAPGTGAVITGNTITGNYIGIAVGYDDADTSTVTAHLNNLADNPGGGMVSTAPPVDATGNWWGTAYKPSIPSHFAGPITIEPYAVDSAMTIMNLPLPTPVFVDLSYTDGSAGGHIFGYDAFNNLKDGISGVAVGGTLNVAAGTYNEYFHINKSMTMVGTSGAASTIIHGGDPYSVYIEATDVTFTGFTVENPDYDGGSDASGIVVGPPWGTPSNIDIHDNVVRDIGKVTSPSVTYGRVGINIAFPYGPVEVYNNEIYNVWHSDSTHDVWANGIGVWGADYDHPATDVNIHDNYIHDVYCPKPRAAGISLQPDVTGISLSNNHIVNTKDYGIELRGGSHDSTLIQDNKIEGTGSNGINYGIRCSDPYPANITSSGSPTATGNIITACKTGVWATDPEPIWAQPPAVPPLVQLNQIYGNITYGMNNTLTGTASATKNWWGNMYGPTNPSNPHGTGDIVTGPATFNPWCTDSGRTEIVSFPLQLKPLMAFPGLFAIPVNETEAATPYLKAVDAVTVHVTSGSATHTIVLPTGTSMTPTAGGNISTGGVLAAYISPSSLTGFEPGAVVRAGVRLGLAGATLDFNSPISVRLYVGPGFEGDRLNIYRSVTNSSGWTGDGIVTVSPPVSGGFVDFQANKASYYAAVSPPRGLGSSFYFAEGYTGPGFVEYLTLGNPSTAAATVDVTYLFPDGSTQPASYSVPAQSRLTVDVNSVVGPNREVSMRVLSAATNIVAERPMYFDYTGSGTVSWTGGHDVVGAAQPGQTWYFAEGYTGAGFDEYVCVLNPGGTKANLTFNFQTEESGLIVKKGHSVGAHSRSTFKVNDILGANYQTSLKLTSDAPVVAERTMYFNYTGVAERNWTGGHCVMGASALAKRYYFAEGSTRNSPRDGAFEEWLTLQNPGTSPITVYATYQLGQGQGDNVNRAYIVQPGRRATVLVGDQVGTFKDVSVLLTSSADFLAERPMYFDYAGTWTGGHCVIGSTTTGTRWFFAEGYTGQDFDEWLCVQNPGGRDATVQITYFTQEKGPVGPRTIKVPAYSRKTINVNEDAGPDHSLSTQLVSNQPVVVERPMYFDYDGQWTGGHDVVGYQF